MICYCIDCNKEIDSRYLRCKSCAKKGKLHPNFKGGKPKCLNCKKQLKDYRSKRCYSCSMKYKLKNGLAKIVSISRKGKRNSIKTEFKSGSNHPYWLNGKSYEIYPKEFNNNLKNKIRKRDNYTCQNCGMTNEEHIIVLGYELVIHHINYNKKNNKENNLISLCNQCNLRANKNRNIWTKYFRKKINDIYKLRY